MRKTNKTMGDVEMSVMKITRMVQPDVELPVERIEFFDELYEGTLVVSQNYGTLASAKRFYQECPSTKEGIVCFRATEDDESVLIALTLDDTKQLAKALQSMVDYIEC
jgi:hypothetical protein